MRVRYMLAAAIVAGMAGEAHGETWHLKTPSSVETDGGSRLRLPPGYFLDEDTYKLRDADLRRLQEQETRLKAENESLRSSAGSFPWMPVAIALAAGLATGVVLVLVQ